MLKVLKYMYSTHTSLIEMECKAIIGKPVSFNYSAWNFWWWVCEFSSENHSS